MKINPQELTCLNRSMPRQAAAEQLQGSLVRDPALVRVQVYNLAGEERVALTPALPLGKSDQGEHLFQAVLPIEAAGITTHLVYFIEAEPESLLLQRGLKKMRTVEPGDTYIATIDLA